MEGLTNFLVIPALLLIIGVSEGAEDYMQWPVDIEGVRIGGNAFSMPVGSILLVRKKSQYCAVKFTGVWQGSGSLCSHSFEKRLAHQILGEPTTHGISNDLFDLV